MKVSLRILKKGNDYHIQRRYYCVWVTLTKCYSEFSAKRYLSAWVKGIQEDAQNRKLQKISEVVEVRHVDV